MKSRYLRHERVELKQKLLLLKQSELDNELKGKADKQKKSCKKKKKQNKDKSK